MQINDKLHQQRWEQSLANYNQVKQKVIDMDHLKKIVDQDNALVWKQIEDIRSTLP